MAKLRHIALSVQNLEAASRFYQEVFGLEKVGEETLESGSGVYLTDGVVNLALLKLKGTDFVGTHHFGFIVDDTDAMGERIKGAGGEFFFSMGQSGRSNAELKYKDPQGIVFDISETGWDGNTCI
ncbi:VOC family protein [Pusillimonas noertemannii]|uniref:Methylmalonyl-CoA epimerase n=1 Tax=Pusillimonas noertemannii TaxID=305977 RepID=A0A2U1CPL0_9BURK|nr:VOC family protein [Pusillimonas noertemannii]NYT67156.1 VOC family protein [Pusillimonas noertemannii]PVY67832.1 methylmalonyl-CoA epimerase [Pusillimonas noertemannii]TFL12642.1 VOC family protein [Pusillimonas noertemannii]